VKAIVVAGGHAAPEDPAQLSGAELVIAADSGAAWLTCVGAIPDLVIGDMDSIEPELLRRLEREGVAIERHPAAKEASDAELAVARAVADGADEIVLLGALGGERLDHELANLLLLADPRWAAIRLRVVRGATTVRGLHAGQTLEVEGPAGSSVTILPIGGDARAVSTLGLRYPLTGETLRIGQSRGLSNEVERPRASVSLEGGTLLVIETRKEPGS
jgi:thiamine pyrophosphokinase